MEKDWRPDVGRILHPPMASHETMSFESWWNGRSTRRALSVLGLAAVVDSDGSVCDPSAPGGLWCMHDALINSEPHNPRMYDLPQDYTDFSGAHRLVTSYLDPLSREPSSGESKL